MNHIKFESSEIEIAYFSYHPSKVEKQEPIGFPKDTTHDGLVLALMKRARKYFSFVIVALIFQIGFSNMVYAQISENRRCPDSVDHATSLKYAAFAEMAYELPGNHDIDLRRYCPNSNMPNIESPIQIEMQNISRENLDIIELNEEICPESSEGCIKTLKDSITNEEIFTCETQRDLTERIAISFSYVRNNERLSLLTKIIIVGVTSLTGNEEVRIMRLQPVGSPIDEYIIGVQGTDASRIIPMLNSSVMELIENSCTFELSVEVAKQFLNPCDNDNNNVNDYTILGHSLGGAVAQYVKGQPDLESIVRECSNDAQFRAYSFNSIGVDRAERSQNGHANTYSVRVAGEFLEQLETEFNREQIGHIFRYGDRSQSELELSLGERLRRHKISTVRREICRCYGGGGEFEYAPPNMP